LLLPVVLADANRRVSLICEEEFEGVFTGVRCDAPIRLVTYTEAELRALVPVLKDGTPYPPAEVARRWLQNGFLGIARAARALLSSVAATTLKKGNPMSLEAAIMELTVAMREAVARFDEYFGDEDAAPAPDTALGAAPAPAAEKPRRGRRTKAEMAAAQAAASPGALGFLGQQTAAAQAQAQAQAAPATGLGFAAAAAAAAPPAAPAAAPPAAAAPQFTYQQVQARLLEVDQQKGRQACVDILARFGCQKLPELNPTQYGAFMGELNAIMAGSDPAAAQNQTGSLFG